MLGPSCGQMRSFRKFYYILFLVVAFFLWNSGYFRTTTYETRKQATWDLASWSPPGAAESKHEYPQVIDKHSHHSHHAHHPPIPQPGNPDQGQSKGSTNPPDSAHPNEFVRGKDSAARDQAVGGTDNDSESRNVDTVERLSNTIGETTDHAASLGQADDDDTGMSDLDLPSFDGDRESKPDEGRRKKPSEAPKDKAKPPVGTVPERILGSEGYSFPMWDECESLKDKADALPNMIHLPFEDAVSDVQLEGWEDEWIANARFSGPKLAEPKIDFVYNWVNGSQLEFVESMHPYEANSSLNDPDGEWIKSHSSNRYREWDELRYSMRSVEKYAGNFTNRIQILVNAFRYLSANYSQPVMYGKQRPHWLRDDIGTVEILSQEDFFGPDEKKCLPTFNSLTIENQLYNTKSETDRLFALSDDMILGKPHAASDLYSPLFGPTMGFKDNSYNTLKPPTEEDAIRFGEKPFLIYTSWLLNRRFGARKRKGQVHFGHSLGRSVAKEAITSFPRPALRSAFQRFRGETGFQLYSWFVIFHYTMERHREALLWSYLMLRSDANDDGYLSWTEREKILNELSEGMSNDLPELYRKRLFYQVADRLEEAGLEAPKVNTDILWTSLDGPAMIQNLDCDSFDTEDCLAPGFATASSDSGARSPVFATAAIFDRVSRESPRCGDCLIKLILNRKPAGLGTLLPHPVKKAGQRAVVVKALMKYKYAIVKPDADFYMITDAEQADHALLKPYVQHRKKSSGQICLNDDVVTQDVNELEALRRVMKDLFDGLLPERSSYEA